MRAGRPRKQGVLREPSGKIGRSRAARLHNGTMVYGDYAVYFAQTADGLTKIGFSGNLQQRMSTLTGEEGEHTRIVGLVLVPNEAVARKAEAVMHRRFADKRDHGEWFNLSRREIADALRESETLGLKTIGLDGADKDVRVNCGLRGAQDWLRVSVVNG